MGRLFTALLPAAPVVTHLAAALDLVAGVCFTPAEKWHITLCFHGDGDDPARRIGLLRASSAGLIAPRLRLRSAGTFPGVLWIGVDDPSGALGTAAGAVCDHAAGHVERQPFRPHLTIARSRRGELDASGLTGYEGPWWVPDEMVLVSSERDADGHRYRALDSVRFAAR